MLAYNRAHKSTRRLVENSFGILKEKFPCLNYLRLQPDYACKVFICCTTLCNIIRGAEDLIPNNVNEEDENEMIIEDHTPAIVAQVRLNDMINHFR